MLGEFNRWKPPSSRPSSTDGASTARSGAGVAMLAPAMFGIAVAEYAPNQVKKTVVGAGHADKNQIHHARGIAAEGRSENAGRGGRTGDCDHPYHHRQSAILKLKVAAAR